MTRLGLPGTSWTLEECYWHDVRSGPVHARGPVRGLAPTVDTSLLRIGQFNVRVDALAGPRHFGPALVDPRGAHNP
jgi:hypothetical protein